MSNSLAKPSTKRDEIYNTQAILQEIAVNRFHFIGFFLNIWLSYSYKMQALFQKNRIFLLHLSFWCLYFSFFFYQVSFSRHGEPPNYTNALLDAFAQIFCMMAISYINYFYCLPRFLKHKNSGRYILEFIIPFVFFVTILIFAKKYIYASEIDSHKLDFLSSTRFIIQTILISLFIAFFVGMLRFAKEWFELDAKKKEIENEKLAAELRFLKAQINPHFLFNTLNNLYYLAFTNSPNTPEVIAKLSQMMRYMIHDSNHAKVPLSKEIEYMENYISLEKLRLNNDIPINFEVKGNTNNLMIVPFILTTFLENAFKHGVSNNSEEAWVNVTLEIETNKESSKCIYSVENSKLQKNIQNEEKSGIGLQNVERRLELSYPNNYELNVQNHDAFYAVKLTLFLN